jgi:uncharacterized membrane protein
MLASHGVDVAASLGWLTAITIAGFLASWFFTVRLALSRPVYIGLLAVVTGLLTFGYTWWAGIGAEFWTNNWLWGIAGAAVVGGLLSMILMRMPVAQGRAQGSGAQEIVWNAAVYGTAEGILLSTLPVLVVWQAWEPGLGGWGAAALALAASLIVIVVHHLGYPAYRGKKMTFPIIGCLPLSVAFLITGSPIAAVGAHAILHVAIMRRGMELPPESEDTMRARTSRALVAG